MNPGTWCLVLRSRGASCKLCHESAGHKRRLFRLPWRAALGKPGYQDDDRDAHEHGKTDQPPSVAKPPEPLPCLLRPLSNLVGRRQSYLAPIVRISSGFIIGSKRSGSAVGSVDLVGPSRRRSAGGAVAVDCSVEATFRTAPDPSSFQVAPNGLSARTIFQGRIIFRELAAPFANKLVVAFHESIRC